MASSFFFYDLETSGTDPKQQRVMQFAGQRTDMDLNPIGDPYNVTVRLSDDIIPDPGALMITGITPQSVREGLRESEWVALLVNEICVPGTIMTGFNSVRFDDEFLRYAMYRNLRDPYRWSWADDRSRWDLLDVVRLTRALRPAGIDWPLAADGRPNNRLETMASANGLIHAKAHDALSDVEALIGVARLIRDKQPKLFTYLLEHRDKTAVAQVVSGGQPFVYATGRYPIILHHTSVAVSLGAADRSGAVLVYNLRHDPSQYADMSVEQLKALKALPYAERQKPGALPWPVKNLILNRCPAVAPLGVLTPEAEPNIDLSQATALRHLQVLQQGHLADRFQAAMRHDAPFPAADDVDAALYGGFLTDDDRKLLDKLAVLPAAQLTAAQPKFKDSRLPELFWRYRARNFPETMQPDEQRQWDQDRAVRIQARLEPFSKEFSTALASATPAQAVLLEDLRLYVESIFPADYDQDAAEA